MDSNGELTKVRFMLEEDENGWPPVESESLWSMPVGFGRYRLDNTPWYVRGVACYDIVEAEVRDPDDMPVVTAVVSHSGHLCVRVIPADVSSESFESIYQEFSALGATGEREQVILALDISPEVPLRPIKEHLVNGEAEGRWEYDEGFVSVEWFSI